MKKSIIKIASTIIQGVIFLSVILSLSCSRPYTVVTRLLPDGSCYREYLINADSSLLTGDTSKNKIPVIIDPSYKVTLFYNTSSGKKRIPSGWPLKSLNNYVISSKNVVLSVRKDFPSARELETSSYFNNTSWKQISHKIKIYKKFRWFFTEYLYKETYPSYNPFRKIPVSKYLTDQEIAIYTGEKQQLYAKKDSAQQEKEMKLIENKVMDWLGHSIYEEFFSITLSNLHAVNINKTDSIKLLAAKDTIYGLLKNSEDMSPGHFVDACCNYLKTDVFRKLLIPNSKPSDDFRKYDKVLDIFSDDFHFSLLMPGIVIYTNADVISSDTMLWKLTAYKFFFHEYRIVVRSRVTNYWTWWFTGGLIVLLTGLIILWRKK